MLAPLELEADGLLPHSFRLFLRKKEWSACRKSLFTPLPVQIFKLKTFENLLNRTRKGFLPLSLFPRYSVAELHFIVF